MPGLRFLAERVADRRLRRVFLGRRAESSGVAAFDLRCSTCKRRACRSRRELERLVSSQRIPALQPQPLPEPDCILRGHRLFALRRDLSASVGLPLVPHETELGVSILPLVRVLEERNLQSFAPRSIQ